MDTDGPARHVCHGHTLYRICIGLLSSTFLRNGARYLKRSMSSCAYMGQPFKAAAVAGQGHVCRYKCYHICEDSYLLLRRVREHPRNKDAVGDEFQPGVNEAGRFSGPQDMERITAREREREWLKGSRHNTPDLAHPQPYQKAVNVWKLMVSRTCSGAFSSRSSMMKIRWYGSCWNSVCRTSWS